MNIKAIGGRLRVLIAVGVVAALLVLPAVGSAGCREDCRALRADCKDACSQEFKDCVRAARTDVRACGSICRDQFERGSDEMKACRQACRDEFLVPAKEECGVLRGDCQPICSPGNCRRECRPGRPGGFIPEDNECIAACAVALHDCASAGKGQLRECATPCRELEDGEERATCFHACADEIRAGREECRALFEGCAAGCDDSGEEEESETP